LSSNSVVIVPIRASTFLNPIFLPSGDSIAPNLPQCVGCNSLAWKLSLFESNNEVTLLSCEIAAIGLSLSNL